MGSVVSADVKSVTFTSEHTLKAPIQGTDGTTYPIGTSVICDNWATDINARVTYSGSVSKLSLQIQGAGGTYTDLVAYPYNVIDTDGVIDASYTIGAGMSPLAITVTPITVTDIKGYTRLAAYANNNMGDVVYSNIIPVVDCS
ncbi:hypothetical protein D3875_06350 [Deinococcus cavernae]|uniref:Uncharacterized protein n=2 Tax=Deinococcus cavernae TaxID=2320857 RepID=A0A418V5B0_9DEIO|nr:hypothetical protein D3875_06350 [Deinococcus cavernae]